VISDQLSGGLRPLGVISCRAACGLGSGQWLVISDRWWNFKFRISNFRRISGGLRPWGV